MLSCSVEDCGSNPLTRGLCSRHYTRWVRYGDPLVNKQPKNPGAECAVPLCGRASKAKGLCISHYSRYRKSGVWPTTPVSSKWAHTSACLRPDCLAPAITKNMCGRHYARHRLMASYGVASWEQFDDMWAAAEGSCELCGIQFLSWDDSSVCVDHCHTTGNPRGILCRKCNSGIGYLNDDITTLRRAIEYIEKHRVVSNNALEKE